MRRRRSESSARISRRIASGGLSSKIVLTPSLCPENDEVSRFGVAFHQDYIRTGATLSRGLTPESLVVADMRVWFYMCMHPVCTLLLRSACVSVILASSRAYSGLFNIILEGLHAAVAYNSWLEQYRQGSI